MRPVAAPAGLYATVCIAIWQCLVGYVVLQCTTGPGPVAAPRFHSLTYPLWQDSCCCLMLKQHVLSRYTCNCLVTPPTVVYCPEHWR